MNKKIVTKAKYYTSPELPDGPKMIIATIDGKELNVPMNPHNIDYRAILDWVDEGNTIEEAD